MTTYVQHQYTWMMFVDGENFTIRGQKVAQAFGAPLREGPCYKKDCVLWLPNRPATHVPFGSPRRLHENAVRSYYYTSLVGDEQALRSVRGLLRDLGFTPNVFKRQPDQKKAKGVDIALTNALCGLYQQDTLPKEVTPNSMETAQPRSVLHLSGR